MEGETLDAPETGACGGLAALAFDQDTPMLHERLRLRLPSIAVVRGMPHSIMAAETSREHEEMIWLESGGARMAIVARELFVREEGDLVSVFSAHTPGGWRLEAAGEVMVATPDVMRREGDDANVAYAWWRDASGLLVAFEVVTDPENARRGGCVDLARRILGQLAPGERAPDLMPRTVSLEGGLLVDVPEGFIATIDVGADFLVYRFEHAGPFDGLFASAGIYLGGDPHAPPDRAPAATDVLLEAPVSWFDERSDSGHHREALVPLGPGGGAAHVFFVSTDEDVFAEVYDAMRTLRRAP